MSIVLECQFNQEVDPPDREAVLSILSQYNRLFLPVLEWKSMSIVARNDDREIVGGLLGEIVANWLHIEVLAVSPHYRGQGIGSELLTAAEQAGKDHHCIGSYLDTLEFQARPFYERHGYTVFGIQEHHPAGFKRYFMQKQWTESGTVASPETSVSK